MIFAGLEHGYFEALQGNSVSWYTNTLLGALSRLASSLPVLCSQTYSKATARVGIVTNALVCGFFIPVLGKGRSHMQLDAFSAKTVVITGASSGIGEALALRLADEGAWLALATRAAPRLVAVAAACRQRGGQAIAIPTNVAVESMRSDTSLKDLAVNLNSLWDFVLQRQQVSGPPSISTWNWQAAKASIAVLAKLEPHIIAGGHGERACTLSFTKTTIPRRYVPWQEAAA